MYAGRNYSEYPPMRNRARSGRRPGPSVKLIAAHWLALLLVALVLIAILAW